MTTRDPMSRRLGSRALVVALVGALALAACGTGSGGEASPDGETSGGETVGGEASSGGEATREASKPDAAATTVPTKIGFLGEHGDDAEPVRGGTLSFGVYSEVPSLDPVKAYGGGAVGATELAAIYGVLMRYDVEQGTYEPAMAKSLEPSDDFSTWTLTLRPDVTFSDGTPLNAEAVVFSMKRHVEMKSSSASLVSQIESYATPGERTVVFHLQQPWAGFPYVLADLPGHIVSPTAVEKYGEDFAKHPVGAGPFVVDSYRPNEELVLTARDDYWADAPYLDRVRFVPLTGDQAKLDALNQGGLNVAFLRDPEVIVEALNGGYAGFQNVINAGSALIVNNGVRGQEDRPGADARVRRAIAHAINPEQINQRVHHGAGLPGKELFEDFSRWSTSGSGASYDVEAAREILTRVQAETGYGGNLTLVCNDTPARKSAALAIQAQLNAVGFDVTLDIGTTNDLIRKVIVEANYDLACWSYSVLESAPYVALLANVGSGASRNYAGYTSNEMDAALKHLRVAESHDEKEKALADVQAVWAETVPGITFAATPELVAWDDDVHGIAPSIWTKVLLNKAWIDD